MPRRTAVVAGGAVLVAASLVLAWLPGIPGRSGRAPSGSPTAPEALGRRE